MSVSKTNLTWRNLTRGHAPYNRLYRDETCRVLKNRENRLLLNRVVIKPMNQYGEQKFHRKWCFELSLRCKKRVQFCMMS